MNVGRISAMNATICIVHCLVIVQDISIMKDHNSSRLEPAVDGINSSMSEKKWKN